MPCESASDRARYGDGSKQGAHDKRANPVAGSIWPGGSGAGTLVVLITFFTSYSHVDIPAHDSIAVNQQIGIPLLLAALAALVEP